MNSNLDLSNPKTFNEKLQWLKLYNRKAEYTIMADKVLAKEYVAKRIGEEHIIPTIGVWNRPEDIDFDLLPDQFVLKTNHNSGKGMIICLDKCKLDFAEARKKLNEGLKQNYYMAGREWPYKNIQRKILAEKYLIDSKTSELRDYKFFCFNGEVKMFKIDFGRFVEHHANYYTPNGDLLPMGEAAYPPIPDKDICMPSHLNEMIMYAELLSQGIPFIRVDFYEVDGKVYFGELTFFPASGLGKIEPPEWNLKMGDWIKI